MSALGNVIEDDDTESAASLLSDAIEETKTEAADREVNTDDVAAMARELAAAKAERKAALEATANVTKAHAETRTAFQIEQERRLQATDDAITNGMVAAQSEVDRLTQEAAKAFEEGNWAKGAEFSSDAAAAKIKLEGFTTNKKQLEGERERIKHQPPDPKDRLTPRTRAWIDAHPRFETDPVYQGWATTADAEARKLGITADTDEYFKYVERRIGENESAMQGKPRVLEPDATDTRTPAERKVAEPTPRTNGASMAAPVTRRTVPSGEGGGNRPGVIKLTADQRDAANRMFADRFDTEKERLEHYWNMQQRLKDSGRLSTQGA